MSRRNKTLGGFTTATKLVKVTSVLLIEVVMLMALGLLWILILVEL